MARASSKRPSHLRSWGSILATDSCEKSQRSAESRGFSLGAPRFPSTGKLTGWVRINTVKKVVETHTKNIMIIEHIGIEGTRLSSEIPHTRTDLAS